ncbi:hypothetical protein QCA50_008609 [Cerrena zonata]|uniref:Uncharacterized protein n=1 Tax=Cerrena zonata TaxID=2478898 RepID=A0AAW0GDU9_9APHY
MICHSKSTGLPHHYPRCIKSITLSNSMEPGNSIFRRDDHRPQTTLHSFIDPVHGNRYLIPYLRDTRNCHRHSAPDSSPESPTSPVSSVDEDH